MQNERSDGESVDASSRKLDLASVELGDLPADPDGSGGSSDVDSDAEEIDPDDLPWEPPTQEIVQTEIEICSSTGVKSISVKALAPPPLQREKKGAAREAASESVPVDRKSSVVEERF